MKLSIVTTLYRSETHINEFYKRASAVAKELVNDEYELIFVNDGSPDNSLNLAVLLSENDLHVIVLDLSRNFGHHKALMTGLMNAEGEQVFLIDSDLEEDPEWLIYFYDLYHSEECDVVYGVQKRRKGNYFERWSGRFFYLVFNFLAGFKIQEDFVTARLMSRRYVNSLILHQEREVFLAGLWHITGYKQLPFLVKKHSSSKSTYSLAKKITQFVNAITSFSDAPLVGIFYIGAIISLLAIAYIIYLATYWLFLAKPLSGWTSLIASIWLLGGMVISFIGILGIYLSKVFLERKHRPYTIVRQIYGQ